MEAKELRIGNFIEIGINPEYKSTIGTVTEISNWIRCDYETGGVIMITFNDAKPIPLTEEWLLKFFNLSKYNQWVNEKMNFSHIIEILNIEIKYVHQLQNFYFSLTGEELIVK